MGEAYRQAKHRRKMEDVGGEEEKEQEVDTNPFSYYRESDIFEINGNVQWLKNPKADESHK